MKFFACRRAAAALTIASTGSLAFGGDSGAEPEAAHTDLHKVLLSEFKFVAKPKDPTLIAPILSKTGIEDRIAAEATANSTPVMMEPFMVREGAKMDELHADIVTQKASARTARIMSKLGIGVHTGPMGFYAITVFFIPIAAGFGDPMVKPK